MSRAHLLLEQPGQSESIENGLVLLKALVMASSFVEDLGHISGQQA